MEGHLPPADICLMTLPPPPPHGVSEDSISQLVLPGLKASPGAFYRVGVEETLVHLLLSRASGNLPFVLTAVLLAAAQCQEG